MLRTTFCLVEQFLNSRPLTAASSYPKNFEALTPNHFLFGGPNAASLFHVPEKAQPDDHRRRYRKSIAYANAIWHQWLTEYAPTLNVRSKWNRQDPTTLKTGDLVWIVEPTSPAGSTRSLELKNSITDATALLVQLSSDLRPAYSLDRPQNLFLFSTRLLPGGRMSRTRIKSSKRSLTRLKPSRVSI